MAMSDSTLNEPQQHDASHPEHPSRAANYEPVWSEAERQQLHRIATNQSARSGRKQGPGRTPPELDPLSDKFDLSAWMKFKVEQFETGAIKRRHTGVLFKDLSVHGSAAEIKLQKTVGSILTAPLHLKEIAQSRSRHKTILQNFDGVVKRGEMLLVLGRPGSGCSTFLKSMSANYEGLGLGEGSVISYDGIPQKVMKQQFRGDILYNGETEKRKETIL